jgi:hypothetical protein
VPSVDRLGLTQDELAARAGVSLDRVKRLAELGVVQPSEADGMFRPIDVQRIRVAEAFVDSGLAVEDLGRLVAEGHVTFPNLEAVFGEPIAASDSTFADFAARLGRNPDLLRRVYAQLGLPQPGDDDQTISSSFASSLSCSMHATSALVTISSFVPPAFAVIRSGISSSP